MSRLLVGSFDPLPNFYISHETDESTPLMFGPCKDYEKYETRNLILLCLFWSVYIGFRAGCLIVLPFSCKILLSDWLDGAAASPYYQLPMAMWFFMDIIIAYPNAMFMRSYGRRAGFLLGSSCAFIASILGFLTLRCVNNPVLQYVLINMVVMLMSVIGMAEYVKYAVIEACTDDAKKTNAVSRVITGGAVLSIVSPFGSSLSGMINSGNELYSFAYFFLLLSGLALIGICAASGLRLPPVAQEQKCSIPLSRILVRPNLWTAIYVQVGVQFLMLVPMFGSPLAMVEVMGISDGSLWISGCIVSHVLSMFLPGLITGQFIGLIGKYPVMSIGLGLQALSIVLLYWPSMTHFYIGLILLGIGWNFAFVSSAILLVDSHSPEERTKVTAFNETFRFVANAVAAIVSSALIWSSLSLVGLVTSVLLSLVVVIAFVLEFV